MKKVSLVDEIRQHRAAILAEAGGTLELLVDRLKDLERGHKDRLVSLPPAPSFPTAE
jgi:hypothetical protein